MSAGAVSTGSGGAGGGTGVAWCSPITTMPVASPMLALNDQLRLTAKLLDGAVPTSVIGTITFLTVCPGAKLNVPSVAV